MNHKTIIENAENGNVSLLDAFIELRIIKNNLENSLQEIKDFEKKYVNEIENESNDYPEGYKGFKITKVNGRTSYSFKNIKEWADTESKKKEIESKYKSLFVTYQKTNERPMSEHGEIYELPEVNYSASYLKLTEITK